LWERERERDRITSLKQFKVHGHWRRDKRRNLFRWFQSMLFNNRTWQWHHHTYHNGTSKQAYIKRHSILLLHIYLYLLPNQVHHWRRAKWHTFFFFLAFFESHNQSNNVQASNQNNAPLSIFLFSFCIFESFFSFSS